MDEQRLLDDGLLMDEVGAWCEDKYKLVGLYIHLFATGMKAKWGKRVYIDLYSGAGISRIRGKSRLVMGSPLIALNARDPFDLYIFCEVNHDKLNALKQRAQEIGRGRNIKYVAGDCNSVVDTICSLIPRASPDDKVLSLCFVDPYDIRIKFSTVRKLSARFIDFLVLLAYMDPNRAHLQYLQADNKKVDEFLGLPGWRKIWEREKKAHKDLKLPDFLARQYAKEMSRLQYKDQELYMMRKVRSDDKKTPLYRLALFSRSERAYDFWEKVLKYSTDQPGLF